MIGIKTAPPPLSGSMLAALNRMEKHGEALRCEDGLYRVPIKYWSITGKEMRALEDRGCVIIAKLGESTIATFVERR